MIEKILYPIFEDLEWLAKHKKLSTLFQWLFVFCLLLLSGLKASHWQFWVFCVVIFILMTFNYIQGRTDGDLSSIELEKALKRIMKSGITKQYAEEQGQANSKTKKNI
jgi:hypothetical protein